MITLDPFTWLAVVALVAGVLLLLSTVEQHQPHCTECRAKLEESLRLLERLVKYAREDNARTPGSTRLARGLAQAEHMIAEQRPKK